MRLNATARLALAAILGCAPSILAAPTPVAIPDDVVVTGIATGVGSAVPTGTACVPQNEGETSCGTICCASWQSCAVEGQCVAKDSSDPSVLTGIVGGNGSGKTMITTVNGVVTTEYIAPFRPTATATSTATSTNGSDESNEDDDDDDDGGGSISAGGIVGIVFGTLIGIAILGALCFFCIARGLWASIFGRRSSNHSGSGSNSNIEVVEQYESVSESDYYSQGGHTAMAAGAGRRHGRRDSWHGEKPPREKKSRGGWLGLGAVAGTMLAMLNMKKDKKARRSSESMYNSGRFESDTSYSSPGRSRRSHSRSGAPTASRSGVSGTSHGTRVTRSTSRTQQTGRSHNSQRTHSTRRSRSQSRSQAMAHSQAAHSHSRSRSYSQGSSHSSGSSRSRSPSRSRAAYSRSHSRSQANSRPSRSRSRSHRSRS